MACRPTSLECRLVAAVEGRELAVGVGWVAGGLVEVNDVVKIFGGAKLGGDRSWKDMVLQVALVVSSSRWLRQPQLVEASSPPW